MVGHLFSEEEASIAAAKASLSHSENGGLGISLYSTRVGIDEWPYQGTVLFSIFFSKKNVIGLIEVHLSQKFFFKKKTVYHEPEQDKGAWRGEVLYGVLPSTLAALKPCPCCDNQLQNSAAGFMSDLGSC